MRLILISCTLTLLPVFSFSVKAQTTASIQGAVVDSTRQALSYSVISLMNSVDSSIVKSAICDEMGSYQISNLKSGNYYVSAYQTGFRKKNSPAFSLNEGELKKVENISLQPLSSTLKEIEVVVQKPFVERLADRTVVNVENSIISAGNSVYEVLERSPGVSIDQDGNISLKGKQGINVMIDGKPTQMSADQLANYLKSMPASMIEKIELISNPSSKYDAEGTAGIINIKTKKGRKDGFNASLFSTYGQGIYEKINNGFNFNFKKKKFNWFGGYSFNKRKDFYDLRLDRTFTSNGTADTKYSQHNFVLFPMNIHAGKLGCDYYAGKNTTIGFVLSGHSNTFNSSGYSNSETFNGSNQLQYYFNTLNTSKEKRQNAAANINIKNRIDTTGKEISADIDYAAYNTPVLQNFTNTYLDLNGDTYQPTTYLKSNAATLLQIYSGKVDYIHPFSASLKLESGIKSSYVTADNDRHFYNTVNNIETIDTGKTNHFLYNENINAAYTNITKDWKKLSVQLGLRAEQTLAHGNQVTTNTKFTRNYGQLFPSVFALYKFNDNNDLSFNYSKRINRPNYQSLNPFIIIIDPTFYKQGNPLLLPELSNTYELGYTLKRNYYASVYYTHTTRNMGTVLLQDNVNKTTTQTEQNMNYSDYFGLNINATFKPFKWWNNFNDISIYNGVNSGEQQGQNYTRGNTVYILNSTNSFILPKNFTAELGIYYHSKEVYGLLDMKPQSGISAGIKKTFMENKLIAKISVNDLFYKNNIRGGVYFFNIDETFARKGDSRVVTASITYNIGKGGNTASSRRQTGAEDEKKRAGSTGG